MKKIVQIIPYYFPAMTFGGPAKVVYEFTKELSKQSNLTVLTSDSLNEHRRIKNSEKLKKTKHFSIVYFKNIINSVAYTHRLFSHFGLLVHIIFNSKNNDLYHIHDVFIIPQIISSYILRIKNKPYLFSPHGILDPIRLKKKSLIKNMLLYFVIDMSKHAKQIIATSEKEKNDLANLGLLNITVIYNGIAPTSIKSNNRFNYLKNTKKLIILYIGKLHSQKGLFELIQAISKSKRFDIQLLIAGKDDGDQNRLENLITKLNIKNQIKFVGYVNEEDKQSLYEISDLFIHNSYSEGFSISILEALNNKLPVLITKQCNFPDVKKYSAGIIIDNPKSNKLVTIIKELSKKELKTFVPNTQKLIKEKYSIKIMAEKLNIEYEKTKKKFI